MQIPLPSLLPPLPRKYGALPATAAESAESVERTQPEQQDDPDDDGVDHSDTNERADQLPVGAELMGASGDEDADDDDVEL